MKQHEKDCEARDQKSYNETLVSLRLDERNLGFVSLVDDSTLVMIGFATSLLQTRISGMAPEQHQFTLVLVTTAVVLLFFTLLRLFIRHLAQKMWRSSRNWCRVVLKMVKFARAASLFLVTHAVSSAIALFWDKNQLSWLETLAAIYVMVLSIYFVLEVFHRVR